METLDSIVRSCAARLTGNQDQYGALSRRTRTLLRRDKERYVRSLMEDVEGYLNANDLKLAYRTLKKLCSKSISRSGECYQNSTFLTHLVHPRYFFSIS